VVAVDERITSGAGNKGLSACMDMLYPLTPADKQRQYSSGHFYCGREVGGNGYHTGGCFTCNGICGPRGGCNCTECWSADEAKGYNKQKAAYGASCPLRRPRS
jgi:hypothetical protein